MNVVVAVDGSKYGRWATEWVAHLRLTSEIRLTALHVIDVVSLGTPFTTHPVLPWNQRLIRAEMRYVIDHGKRVGMDTRKHLNTLGLKGNVVVQRGAVVPTIVKHAKKRDSLILIGSRGLGALDRFLIGSVSAQVVHRARCPVLVVKEPARQIRRILLATDGSKAAQKSVSYLCKNFMPLRIRPNGSAIVTRVDVMHVMPYFRYPELKKQGRRLAHQTGQKLSKVGFQVEEVPKLGHAAEEIIQYAEREKVDLIVTGARGLGAVARLLLGSVSSKLLHHSPSSVLIVR